MEADHGVVLLLPLAGAMRAREPYPTLGWRFTCRAVALVGRELFHAVFAPGTPPELPAAYAATLPHLRASALREGGPTDAPDVTTAAAGPLEWAG